MIDDGGRPARVLMIAPTSFFGDYGGHIRILEETLALQRLGHSVQIVTYYKGKDVPGLDIRRTPPLPWHAEYEVGSSRHKIAFDVYLAASAWRAASHFQPDIIHGHMHEGALIGGVIARARRRPLVFDFQGSLTAEMLDHGFIRPGGLRNGALLKLERFITRQMPAAILTSSLRACRLLEEEFDVPDERLHPLPDCVDLDRFRPGQLDAAGRAAMRADWGIPPDVPVIAYLGLLADYQGIPDLIETAGRLKEGGSNAHFLIMGYPRVAEYRELAARRGVADRVILPGRVKYDEAPQFLSLGDIAVSAKISRTEGSGKVLNYMAMGLPVVAYGTAVHREYLGDAGVYAPPGDIAGLTAALAALLDDPARGRRLGEALRRRAREKYSWRQAGQKISALYSQLLAEGSLRAEVVR